MGVAVSTVISKVGNYVTGKGEGEEKKLKEKLTTLEKLMDGKRSYFELKLPATAFGDARLPGLAVVDTKEQTFLCSSHGENAEIENVIGSFFKHEWQEGIKGSINQAVKVVLGSGMTGEQFMTSMAVNFEFGTLVRHDYVVYSYVMETESFTQDYDQMMFYYVQTTVLDMERIAPPVILYEMMKSVTDVSGKLDQYQLQEMMNTLDDIERYSIKLFGVLKRLVDTQKGKDIEVQRYGELENKGEVEALSEQLRRMNTKPHLQYQLQSMPVPLQARRMPTFKDMEESYHISRSSVADPGSGQPDSATD